MPGASVLVQLDEPSVPAVLQGGLPTVSGFGKLAAVEATVVEQELADLVVAARRSRSCVHCCAPARPDGPLPGRRRRRGSPSTWASSRTSTPSGTAIEAGTHLFPGVVPGTDAALPAPKATASRVQAWWRELGFAAEQLPGAVTLTPSCGLAGATPGYARAAMAHVREAAKYLQPE